MVASIDAQGRLVIPKSLRQGVLKGAKEVALIAFGDQIRIMPRNVDLAKYLDSVVVDVPNFSDYHALRRDLRVIGSTSR